MNEPFMLSLIKQQESLKDKRKKIQVIKKDSYSQVQLTQNSRISSPSKRQATKERTSININATPQLQKSQASQSNNVSMAQESRLKAKEEIFLLNPPKPYLGGVQQHKVFVNIKQLTFEEKQTQQSQERPSLIVLNPQTINFNNINIDPKKKKIVQKEKSYTFDQVLGEESNNQQLYKKAMSPMIQKFVAGWNQSILVFGGDSSGKTQTLVGGMRDPGIFVLSLEEIFDILYASPDRENTTLKMSMYYNYESHFYDLLVNHKYPHKLYEKENGEVFPLGISEVIVTSLRTSLKILKIGLDNIENSEDIKRKGNIILCFKCERSENVLVSQDTIYSSLKIVKTSDGSYEEIINNQQEECMMSNLMNCLRQLSKMSTKKKNAIIPFRKHIFTEFLRESLVGNSYTGIICCLSNSQKRVNDTANILRLGNSCKKISTIPKETKSSQVQQQNIYNDILENIGNTISIWLKEFWGEIDKSKQRRLKIILRILKTVEKFLYALLDGLEQQIQIDLIKNALFAKILDMHCKVYSESITSEDIKEFYIAKIQLYAQKQLNEQFEQIYPTIHFVLQQLEEGKERIIKNKNKLNNFLRHYAEAKKVCQNGNIKEIQNQVPPDIKITPLLLLNVQALTNLDIEKMGFLQKLFSKFQESCETRIELNQYVPQIVRTDIGNCLKDYKFLEKTILEEGINNTEESNMNTSRMSFRFNASAFKPTHKVRNSNFKQYDTYSRSRLNSQLSEPSLSRQNTSQFEIGQSQQGNLQKLDRQASQAYNETQSEVSKDDDQEQEDLQSDYYLNDKSRIKGLNNSQIDKSSLGEKPRIQDKLDARKIKELQVKLKIIPREKNIYVNNTKLSFKKQLDEHSKMNLFTKSNNLRQNAPQYTNSANISYNSMNNFSERQKGQIQNLFQLKSDSIQGNLLKDEYRKYSKQDTLFSQECNNDDKLIEKIFTNNTKYSSMYQQNKQFGNIFLTQLAKDSRNSLSYSQLLQDKNVLSKKQSITSLNFNPSDIPSFRKFPQMLNTVYSYKLPTLSESVSKESIQKFMNP